MRWRMISSWSPQRACSSTRGCRLSCWTCSRISFRNSTKAKPAGFRIEYTPLPSAKFPTQLEESYVALKWVAAHAGEFGADGNRIAIAGNSVGGNMTAALTLMAKDRKGPTVVFQVLLIPATDAGVDTDSYHEFATGRFLARTFMKYGWDLYAPDEKTSDNPYVSPLRASKN